jgi:hypothetical protein
MAIVSSSNPTTPDPEAIESLIDQIQGDVYLPGDPGFDDAIVAWGALMKHTPTIAVMPQSTHDISRALAFAHYFDMPVAVQGTGHGIPIACDGGMLINTSRMQGVSIFPELRVARVEAGVTWDRVITAAAEHGLAPLNGSSSGVGVIGYTLGGGYGWLGRKYGRAADRVVAADMVTATGELLHVSADSHPDLFWALRGGSGNFGIVTSLEFELLPVEEVFGGSVMYPLADAPRVFDAYSAWTRTLPEDITSSIAILRLPPVPTLPPPLQGAQLVVIRACAVGDPRDAEAAIAPIRAISTPVMDSFGVMPYTAIDAISMDPKESMPARATAMMLRELDSATIEALLQTVGPGVESPLLSVEVRDYRRSDAGTVNEGVGAHYGISLFAVGAAMGPDDTRILDASLADLREAMGPYMTERTLLNLLGDGDVGPERTRSCFITEEFTRLQAIKRQYDPQNRFCFNHNIPPAQDA